MRHKQKEMLWMRDKATRRRKKNMRESCTGNKKRDGGIGIGLDRRDSKRAASLAGYL